MNIWLTVKDLATYLKIKEKTIYYLVKEGHLPHYRVEKLIRFRQDEIDTWIESKKAKSLKKQVDKVVRSIYTPIEGRPDRLQKEVYDAV